MPKDIFCYLLVTAFVNHLFGGNSVETYHHNFFFKFQQKNNRCSWAKLMLPERKPTPSLPSKLDHFTYEENNFAQIKTVLL
jgi:hypothetical protein